MSIEALQIFGPQKSEKILRIKKWIDGYPHLSKTKDLGQFFDFWDHNIDNDPNELFSSLSEYIYLEIRDALGEEVINKMYDSSFKILIDRYKDTENLAFVFQLMPLEILDDKKITVLTPDQMKEAFISRITNLKNVNMMLNQKTIDLIIAGHKIERQRSQLILSDRMKVLGEMAGGVAHEINNPLAIILGNAELIADILETTDQSHSDLGKSAKTIIKTTHRISRIVKGLKAFSRDNSEDPMEIIPIHSVIIDSLSMCQEKFKTLGVKIRYNETPLDIIVNCKPVQISQVILNLLNNACDAVIGYIDPWVEVQVHQIQSGIQICVVDCGAGVPIDVQEKIMQPFFTTKEVGKGTGLGLSISLGIMKNHNGILRYEKGCEHTKFVVELPTPKTEKKVA